MAIAAKAAALRGQMTAKPAAPKLALPPLPSASSTPQAAPPGCSTCPSRFSSLISAALSDPVMEEARLNPEFAEHLNLKELSDLLQRNDATPMTWDVDWRGIVATAPTNMNQRAKRDFIEQVYMDIYGAVRDMKETIVRHELVRDTFVARVTSPVLKCRAAVEGQPDELAIEDGALVLYRKRQDSDCCNSGAIEARLCSVLDTLYSPEQTKLRVTLSIDRKKSWKNNRADDIAAEYFNAIIAKVPVPVDPHADMVSQPGFPVNCVVDELGNTALHYMAGYGKAGCIPALLKAGANPNVANNEGVTPLHAMCQRNNYVHEDDCATSVPLLLEANGINVNAVTRDGHTPLMTAIISQRYQVAQALLEHCKTLDLTKKDKQGRTALSSNHKPTLQLLESYKPVGAPAASAPATAAVSKLPTPSAAPTSASAASAADPQRTRRDELIANIVIMVSEVVADDLKNGSEKQTRLRHLTYELKKLCGQ